MQSVSATIRQKWFWLCQNNLLWVNVLLTAVTAMVLCVKPACDNSHLTDLPVRLWGMGLQLIGAYTVWVDLTGTAKEFGVQPFSTWEALKNLFRTFPLITVSATAMPKGVEAVAGVGTVTATGTPPSLEERVASLEDKAAVLSGQLTVARQELRSQKDAMTQDLQKLEGELGREIHALQGQIKDAFTGNYRMLRIGAFWLVVGIILSSIAIEITNGIHLHQLPMFW
ncbi:MAG: hypothetical protein M3Y65_00225 [Pseudomonadota bacterium]|nr:hypothetical protein [Pseudomonadota bacterium]